MALAEVPLLASSPLSQSSTMGVGTCTVSPAEAFTAAVVWK